MSLYLDAHYSRVAFYKTTASPEKMDASPSLSKLFLKIIKALSWSQQPARTTPPVIIQLPKTEDARLAQANSKFNAIQNASKEQAIKFIQEDPEAFRYISKDLKNDVCVTRAAVFGNGHLLGHAGEKPRSDKITVLMAARQAGLGVLPFASEDLKNDPEFMLKTFFESADYQTLKKPPKKNKEQIRSYVNNVCIKLSRFVNNPHCVQPKFPEYHEHLQNNEQFKNGVFTILTNELSSIIQEAGLQDNTPFKNEMMSLLNATTQNLHIKFPQPSKRMPERFDPTRFKPFISTKTE